jgi:hypothetical protein
MSQVGWREILAVRFSERKLVADLSRFSFAGLEAGEQKLRGDCSAVIFGGWFLQIYES